MPPTSSSSSEHRCVRPEPFTCSMRWISSAGLICPTLPNVLRPDGEKHTLNRHLPTTMSDTIRFLMIRRKSTLLAGSAPGPDSWRKSTRATRRIGAPPDRSVRLSQVRLGDGQFGRAELQSSRILTRSGAECARILRYLVRINRGPSAW